MQGSNWRGSDAYENGGSSVILVLVLVTRMVLAGAVVVKLQRRVLVTSDGSWGGNLPKTVYRRRG